MRIKALLLGAMLFAAAEPSIAQNVVPADLAASPMPVGVVGLTHDHVGNIFNSAKRGDIKIVGIVEPNRALAQKYADRYGFSMDIVYADIGEMIDKTHPVAVTGFDSIAEHIDIVRAAAPRHVHVMVEKPLAFSMKDATEMEGLAKKYHIQLLTNYETTWYPTLEETKAMVNAGKIGPVTKMVFHDGHQGPKTIGVSPEFLSWLTDPKKNGGGAIIDFGCYGANMMTWLTEGERPVSVTAVTRNFQPGTYPKVDDDATIVVDYAKAQGIAQASWDWPVGRKDMEVYGTTGQVISDNKHDMRVWGSTPESVTSKSLPDRPYPFDDSNSYFRAVIDGRVTPPPYDPSSLENNMLVVEILDAARQSAVSGKTVKLPAHR